jgi:hypothetical protein
MKKRSVLNGLIDGLFPCNSSILKAEQIDRLRIVTAIGSWTLFILFLTGKIKIEAFIELLK